jgi:nucleoside-diphosphate-sugar epimerase
MGIIELINKTTDNKTPIHYKPRRLWDTKPRLLASIEKASRLIQYKPLVDFDEGFILTKEWFTDNWEMIEKLADFKPGMSSAVR